MIRKSVWFIEPGKIAVLDEELSPPGPGEVLVNTVLSAISSGTEMLFYRGLVPENLALDGTIASLTGAARFPFKYGYSCVGVVSTLGEGVDVSWMGQRVFSFQPHESAFLALPEEMIRIPEGIDWEDALFLPNMETAVNLVMDAAPRLGENVAVFGLGVVGLLTAALLAQYPLGRLVGVDPLVVRREMGEKVGAGCCIDPNAAGSFDQMVLKGEEAGSQGGMDLVIECSGSPQALNQAISITGFEGRVVIGSWYGKRPVQLDLGGRFHRSRIQLISSQVSTLAAGLSARWSKARRFGVAWEQIRKVHPSRWITHRYEICDAALGYRQLAESPAGVFQVILEY